MTVELLSLPFPKCPLCHHASGTLSDQAPAAGGHWRCVTCGQSWSTQRLATVAAYEAWAVNRH